MMTFTVDAQHIGHLVFDRDDQAMNLMDLAFTTDFAATAAVIKDTPNLRGVIMRSGKPTFFAGGDLVSLSQVTDATADALFDQVESLKNSMRQIETLGIPVVACLNGAALGGGWELALCCHFRIAVDKKDRYFGLPEVTLGLLPGGGGVTRMTRLLGLQAALPYLTEGKKFNAAEGLQSQLIDQVVAGPEALEAAAISHIMATEHSQQPWDTKGFKLPGGHPSSPALQQLISVAPALLRQKTRGNFPAPIAILSAAIEGAALDFDTASRIESRYLVQVARSPVAKSMINTFFFQMNALQRGKFAPQGNAKPIKNAAVVGAGMMGSGIAWALASKGVPVMLLDTSLAVAKQGKAYVEKLVEKRVSKGRLSAQKGVDIVSLISLADDIAQVANADLVIEAVVEDRAVKSELLRQVSAVVSTQCIIASNTSTLPISGLAESVSHPERFMGMHFFSPVEQMQLIELIAGKKTHIDTQASLYQLTSLLGKMPILVQDSRGFYTSRVFQSYIYEGMRMLSEGVPAASIENAAWLAGMPMGPLTVVDNVSLTLIAQIIKQTKADLNADGETVDDDPAELVLNQLISANRTGKSSGAGFYDYDSERTQLWDALPSLFPETAPVPLPDLVDRLLYAQSIESFKAYNAGIVGQIAEANIGAIFALGFPAWTGGTLEYIKQVGVDAFTRRCQDLSTRYGERFAAPSNLNRLS